MQRFLTAVFGVMVTVIAVLPTGCDTTPRDAGIPDSEERAPAVCERIVSLSPSITETLFALGLGDRVAGVSRFCTYPPEAAGKPSVGGYLDPNYEMIASLRPDIVMLLPEHEAVREYLDGLGIRHVSLPNRTVEDITGTIAAVGRMCGVAGRADSLLADIRSRINAVEDGVSPGPRPAVLISIGRTLGAGTLDDVYVAGRGTSYDELIELAGGRNAYRDDTVAYPLLSVEGLLHLDPDIIVDLVPDLEKRDYDRAALRAEWGTAGTVRAVEDSMVFVLGGSYTVIPGPRFILFLEDLAGIIQSDGAIQ